MIKKEDEFMSLHVLWLIGAAICIVAEELIYGGGIKVVKSIARRNHIARSKR